MHFFVDTIALKWYNYSKSIKHSEEDKAGLFFLQRVGGCCEPMESFFCELTSEWLF